MFGMYYKDYLMRQINIMVEAMARIIFQKERAEYVVADYVKYTQTDLLHNKLTELLANSNINEAEDLLFDSLDADDDNHLLVALDFYTRLNECSDEYLMEHDFSREEIESGLTEIKKLFGVEF